MKDITLSEQSKALINKHDLELRIDGLNVTLIGRTYSRVNPIANIFKVYKDTYNNVVYWGYSHSNRAQHEIPYEMLGSYKQMIDSIIDDLKEALSNE